MQARAAGSRATGSKMAGSYTGSDAEEQRSSQYRLVPSLNSYVMSSFSFQPCAHARPQQHRSPERSRLNMRSFPATKMPF